MTTVITNVDGHNLNASHFGAMSEEEAVKRIIQDGFTKEETWARKAYEFCRKALGKEPVKAEAKPAKK